MVSSSENSEERSSLEPELRERLEASDEETLAELFAMHRDRLLRVVRFRMDRRLAARIDADDVLQEAFLAARQRLSHYLKDSSQSLFVWFRLITQQTLIDLHRRHLTTNKRDAGRDVSMNQSTPATSVALAAGLMGNLTSPSRAAMRAEIASQLEGALATLPDLDQEILALRHFEELTNKEAAEVLKLQPTTASNRYIRALTRLKSVLEKIPGFFDDLPG